MIMKKIKKQMTFLLVIALIMSSFSATAFADQFENGDNTDKYNYNNGDDIDINNDNGICYDYDGYNENHIGNEQDLYGYETENIEPISGTFMGIMPFGATSNIPPEYEVEVGEAPELVIPAWEQLRPGEVWSGKRIEYPEVETFLGSGEWVSDGTAIIYIYIRGKPYNGHLLALDGDGHRRVFVEAKIDEFQFTDDFQVTWDTSHSANVWNFDFDSVSRTLSFYVDEEAIKSSTEPFRLWYHVYLDEDPNWRINHWYSTDSVNVKFRPHMSNLFYWTKEETTEPEFVGTVNWNNGWGLVSAHITDNILGISITFGESLKNIPQRQLVENVPFTQFPQFWANNATVDGQSFWWHLYWMKGTPKVYKITVRGLEQDADGNPVDITYVLDLPGGGGNTAIAAGRYRVSQSFFKRNYDPEGNRFAWDENGRLVQTSTSVAQIMLTYEDMPLGVLSVVKLAKPLFPGIVWYYDDENWTFTAGLRTANGLAKFAPVFDNGAHVPNTYRFNGFTTSDIFDEETTLTFRRVGETYSQTITIIDLPVYGAVDDISTTPLMYELVEFFTYATLGLITVYYGIDEPPTNPATLCSNTYITSGFFVYDTLTNPRHVTLKNIFDHGIGFLEVFKLLDGFPGDWDVDGDTDFYVRIFHIDTDSYLLFYPELITQVLQGGLPIQEDPAFNGTWWCVGNHKHGLTAYYDSGMIPIMELPIRVVEHLRISNLWTGMQYEIREVKRADVFTGAQAEAIWNDFWNNAVGGAGSDNRISAFESGTTWASLVTSDLGNELAISMGDDLCEWLNKNWITNTNLWEYVRPIEDDQVWHADKEWTWGVIYPTEDEEAGTVHPTRPIRFNQTETVVITNRFKYHGGDLRIMKELCANAIAWGITDDTVFHARVWADEDSVLVFVPENLNYRVIGVIEFENGVYGAYTVLCTIGTNQKPESVAITQIPFSVNMPAVLIQIPVHPYAQLLYYTVEEIIPDSGIPGLLSVEYFVKDPEGTELMMPFEMAYNETINLTFRNNFRPRPSGNNGGGQPPANNQADDLSSCQAFLIGTPDGLINPRNNITRAEIATVFFRMISDETRENYWLQENPFADVQLHQWFNNAVSTTVNMGLFEGVYEGGFAPNQAITRGELAAVLVRFMVYEDHATLSDYENRFNDIAGHWARDYINIAAGEGWIQGDDGLGGAFRPGDRLTRAEAAAMINRIFGCLVHSHEELLPNMISWPDNQNPASWYYIYIKMATNSYAYDRLTPDARYKVLHDVLEPRDWSVLERPNSRPRDIR